MPFIQPFARNVSKTGKRREVRKFQTTLKRHIGGEESPYGGAPEEKRE